MRRVLLTLTLLAALGCGSSSSDKGDQQTINDAQSNVDLSQLPDQTGTDSLFGDFSPFPDTAVEDQNKGDKIALEEVLKPDLSTVDTNQPDLATPDQTVADLVDAADTTAPKDAAQPQDTSVADQQDLAVMPDVAPNDASGDGLYNGYDPANWTQCKTSADCKAAFGDGFNSTCDTSFPGGRCTCGGTNSDSKCSQLSNAQTLSCVLAFCQYDHYENSGCPPWLTKKSLESSPYCLLRLGCTLNSDECGPYTCGKFGTNNTSCQQ